MLEAPTTKAARSVEQKHVNKGELLVTGLPYLSVIDDGTVMLRDGDLIGAFAVEGVNADTIDSRQTM